MMLGEGAVIRESSGRLMSRPGEWPPNIVLLEDPEDGVVASIVAALIAAGIRERLYRELAAKR